MIILPTVKQGLNGMPQINPQQMTPFQSVVKKGAKIHPESNGTESQRIPVGKVLELLDTQV